MAEVYPKRVSFNNFLRASYPRLLIGAVLMAGLYIASWLDYLLFHSLVELFSVIIAFTIFILIWNSRGFLDNGYLRLLGIAYLSVGILDLLHALAYKGMTVFPGTANGQTNAANLATQLWLAGRYVQSATMAVAPLFLHPCLRRVRPWTILTGYILIMALLLGSIAWGIFPASYLDSRGLTPFKIASEYIIILLFATGLLGLLGTRSVREAFDDDVRNLIAFSLVFNIIAEIAFTDYLTVYDAINLLGHFFKILAVYLIYQAIIVTGLLRPYNLLFRELAQR